jgi:hypothetical protein
MAGTGWSVTFTKRRLIVDAEAVGQATGYFVGWGSLALINAGIAQGKNRSGLNWFLLSLLLGPVATFCLVALFPKLPTTAGQ